MGEKVEVWPSPQWTVPVNGPMPVMASVPRLIDVLSPAKVLCEALGAVRTGGTSREVITASAVSQPTLGFDDGESHRVGSGVARGEREGGAGPVRRSAGRRTRRRASPLRTWYRRRGARTSRSG